MAAIAASVEHAQADPEPVRKEWTTDTDISCVVFYFEKNCCDITIFEWHI